MNLPISLYSSLPLVKNLAKSLRPRTIIISWIIYVSVVVSHTGFNVLHTTLGLILFIATYGIVAIQNDISDYRIDKLNHRSDIPYANDAVTKASLLKLMLGLSLVATMVGALLSPAVLPWVGLYLLLGWLYSGPFNIKSRGIFAAILLGFCYGALPWFIGQSAVNVQPTLQLLAISFASFVFASGVIVLKDFKDVKGDTKAGKRTLLVAKGALYTRRYYLLTTSAAYLILIVQCSLGSQPLMLLIGLVLFAINYLLLRDKILFINTSQRSKKGNWSRGIFFGYAILVYITTLGFTQ